MDKGRFAITVSPLGVGRWLLCAALVCVFALLSARDGSAEDEVLFQVLGIRVDETDQTAAAARTKALATGERRAWEILVQRLVDPAQRPRMAALPQIGDAVKDFWVTDEKTSPVRYIATLNYNFSPAAVKRLLASRGARFATTRSNPVVVVPVFIGAEAETGAETAWREAWRNTGRDLGLVPIRLAPNDVDRRMTNTQQALNPDRNRIVDLARREPSEDVLVTVATVASGVDAGPRQLKVSSTRYPAEGPPQPLADKTYPLAAPDNDAAVLAEAAAAVLQELQNNWRRSNAVSIKPVSRTMVRVPTLTLDDWVAMRRRLMELPQAQGVQVLSVGREYAALEIAYPGDTDDLASALARQGLAMRNEEGHWLIMDASLIPPAEAIPPPGETTAPPAAPEQEPLQ